MQDDQSARARVDRSVPRYRSLPPIGAARWTGRWVGARSWGPRPAALASGARRFGRVHQGYPGDRGPWSSRLLLPGSIENHVLRHSWSLARPQQAAAPGDGSLGRHCDPGAHVSYPRGYWFARLHRRGAEIAEQEFTRLARCLDVKPREAPKFLL